MLKNQLPSMTSKCSHYLIKLPMLIGVTIQQRISLRNIIGLQCKRKKGAKIRNRYNQVQHLTQDTNGKVTNSQQDNTNEGQEVSPFQTGDHKAHTNRRAQRHNKHKTEKNIKDPEKE